MAGYDIRTMTGHEVLVGMVNAANPSLNFQPGHVTFSNVTAVPIPTRPGRTQVTMAAIGYRGTVTLTYGRIPLSAAFTDERTVELYSEDTQAELVAKLNEVYRLNLGTDDYILEEGPLDISGNGQRNYTLTAAVGSLVWYGSVTFSLTFGTVRLMEDGSARLMEDGTVRMLEE